jgi:FkbM family methyltransferase
MNNSFNKKDFIPLINKKNPLIFDIGCYDGSDSLELSKLFDDPIIYSFEADKRSIKLFKEKNHPSNIKLIEKAISNTDEGISWFPSTSLTRKKTIKDIDWSASSSSKPPKSHLNLFGDVQFNNTVNKVPSCTLDSFVKQENLSLIDLIWVDVNGAEEDFILGAKNSLPNKTRYLFIEFSNIELYENQITLNDIKKMLPDFELLGIYDYLGNFGNALFKNKNL